MNCRITDCTIIISEGTLVYVSSDHFDEESRIDKYYGRVVRIIQEGEQAHVKWEDDGLLSVEIRDDLNLEKDISRKKKFELRIAPTVTENEIDDSNISFNGALIFLQIHQHQVNSFFIFANKFYHFNV